MNDSLDVMAKYMAAGSSEASTKDLEEWASDSSIAVRRRVAENSRTPLHCLILLAHDSEIDVQIAVSENAYTPKWLIEELSSSEDADLRYSMAENANLPQDILEILKDDENPYVAQRAERTLRRLVSPANLIKSGRFDKYAEALECIWQIRIS